MPAIPSFYWYIPLEFGEIWPLIRSTKGMCLFAFYDIPKPRIRGECLLLFSVSGSLTELTVSPKRNLYHLLISWHSSRSLSDESIVNGALVQSYQPSLFTT